MRLSPPIFSAVVAALLFSAIPDRTFAGPTSGLFLSSHFRTGDQTVPLKKLSEQIDPPIAKQKRLAGQIEVDAKIRILVKNLEQSCEEIEKMRQRIEDLEQLIRSIQNRRSIGKTPDGYEDLLLRPSDLRPER